MNNELVSDDYIKTQLKTFSISDSAIEELSNQYMPLIINGLEDKVGYKSVVEARKHVKGYRVSIDHRRKELTADALKIQRAINGEAARLTAKLEVIEDYLLKQEDAFEAEKEKVKKQTEEEQTKIFLNRISLLESIGFKRDMEGIDNSYFSECSQTSIFISTIKSSDDALFKQFYELESEKFRIYEAKKAEEKRITDEAIRIEKEKSEAIAKEKVEREAKEIEEEKARQAEIRKQQEAENLRLKTIAEEQEKKRQELLAEEKRLQQEEKARQDAIESEKIRKQEIELHKVLVLKQEKDKIEKQKYLESLKPAIVQLTELHIRLSNLEYPFRLSNLEYPLFVEQEIIDIISQVRIKIRNVCKFIEDKIQELQINKEI